jgi:hypothetical protein
VSFHVGGPAKDVNRTPRRAVLFLTGHAGRGAWTRDVCLRDRTSAPQPTYNSHQHSDGRSILPSQALLSGLWDVRELSAQYQNPVRNPYPSVPRPPQTQAAHFKRLYRK